MITHDRDAEITRYLAGAVVDARLELTSWLGNERLAKLNPAAGSIKWDTSERRGALDLDVAVAQRVLNARHPLANVGQVLEAEWAWPELGVSIPCGRWLISEPAELDGPLWRVAADPEGPARLQRARWYTPGGRVIVGTMASQIGQMLLPLRMTGTPSGSWDDTRVPPTECEAGDTYLSSIEQVLAHAGAQLRPARRGSGVMLSRPLHNHGRPDWVWSTEDRPHCKVAGEVETSEIVNRVTVWYEQEIESEVEGEESKRIAKGYTQPLYFGPRRWDGPYGQVPLVHKLDGPVPDEELRTQAKRMLREAQEAAATVRVEMRADPRIEVGDLAHIKDPHEGTDCVGRVSSVELNAADGTGVVTCAVSSGAIAGEPVPTDPIP